jgi:hypothetical protein
MPIDMKALARLGAHARITELVAEIDSLLRGFPDLGKAPTRPANTSAGARFSGRRKGHKVSAVTKAKLKAAWAKRKAAASKTGAPDLEAVNARPVTTAVAAKKRTMSAEARARISAAQKRRWAAQKKGAKKR